MSAIFEQRLIEPLAMIPKDHKIYDDIWRDVLRHPHGTTPAAVKINKF